MYVLIGWVGVRAMHKHTHTHRIVGLIDECVQIAVQVQQDSPKKALRVFNGTQFSVEVCSVVRSVVCSVV
jgi:hypothetical protein